MDFAISVLSDRWPCFTRIYYQTWVLVNNVAVISNAHGFRYTNHGFCYWFSCYNRAIANTSYIYNLPLDWLDKYEAKLSARLCSRPVLRGGLYPFAASVADLTREGSIYITPLDKYNSKKKSRKCALEKINNICGEIFDIMTIIWTTLPQPIAEELAPALFTTPVYDRESPPR